MATSLTPEQRRAVARRRVLLANEDYGPAYLRLSASDRSKVDRLISSGDSRGARREILALDEARRARRRGEGVSLNGVAIDRSLTPLEGRVPLRDHEDRHGFTLSPFDYQCTVTVREFDGRITRHITDNLNFSAHPTKRQIALFGIDNIAGRMEGDIPSSDKVAQGTVVRIALLVARRRA